MGQEVWQVQSIGKQNTIPNTKNLAITIIICTLYI